MKAYQKKAPKEDDDFVKPINKKKEKETTARQVLKLKMARK